MSAPRPTTYVVRPPRGLSKVAKQHLLMKLPLTMGLRVGALATAVLLGACAEKSQVAATKKADGKPWEVSQNAHVVPGWKPGEQASWEQQLKARSQNQNEYSRAPAKP